MTERQQLAEAIGRAGWLGPVHAGTIAVAVEPFLVAAERAGYERAIADDEHFRLMIEGAVRRGKLEGYERCKRDATTGIEALAAAIDSFDVRYGDSHALRNTVGGAFIAAAEALAVVAALNATQQGHALVVSCSECGAELRGDHPRWLHGPGCSQTRLWQQRD